MYRPRTLGTSLREALGQFPAVLITGPRQSGKTTLLQEELGEHADYVSFDDPLERSFAIDDPNGFLDRFRKDRVLLDEIQYVPEILPYLKLRIDRRRQDFGRWVLTGSQQFQLMASVSESLAGRIAILELPPFSLLEVPADERGGLDGVIWNGGYPDPALHPDMRDLWASSYLRTYVERDVRNLTAVRDLRAFESFLSLSAARHSQELSMATLARDSGVSQPTIKSWVGVLEASYFALLVRPYLANLGKRIVKSPRFYFLDSALACALTRQPNAEAAIAGAMGGALFEGLIVSEAFKAFAARGMRPDLYYWRSHDGLEIDLLIQAAGELIPVEIKLTATPRSLHLRPLNRFRELARAASPGQGILVCRVPEPTPMAGGNLALPWQLFPAWLDELLVG